MPSRIKYEAIKDLKPEEAYDYLIGLEKPVVKDIKLRELLHEKTMDKPFVSCAFADGEIMPGDYQQTTLYTYDHNHI